MKESVYFTSLGHCTQKEKESPPADRVFDLFISASNIINHSSPLKGFHTHYSYYPYTLS